MVEVGSERLCENRGSLIGRYLARLLVELTNFALKTLDFCISIIWSAPAMRFCAAQRRATRLRCDKEETAAFQLIRVAFPGVTLAIAVD